MSPRAPIEREAIAVIGIGCRLPKADGTDEFWRLLVDGGDAISTAPAERWIGSELASRSCGEADRVRSQWGGFVERFDEFDAPLFGIDAREAEHMDPQQGAVLECSWRALEDAALAPDSLSGSNAGVFVGMSTSDFDRRLCRHLPSLDLRSGTGTSYSIGANRVSYALGLIGPSLVVDAACASSSAAIALACQSLWLGECDWALAGGVNMILSLEKTLTFARGNMLSQDGRCKSFAAGADGYVRGEGCGMLVLKPLAAALAAGDPVRAVLRGVAMNHNGRSNGISAPMGKAQSRVIRAAWGDMPQAVASVGYVEAHGSGTLIGDAIEFGALAGVYGEVPGKRWIGCVKSNIGHLEGAAGSAAVIKSILALEHAYIPRTLHCDRPNPHLRLSGRFAIAAEGRDWPDNGGPRTAAVNAVSFGGANVHIVLEQAPVRARKARDGMSTLVLPLSAASEEALRTLAGDTLHRMHALARSAGRAAFEDACFTYAVGRARLHYRLAVIADSAESTASALESCLRREEDPRLVRDAPVISSREISFGVSPPAGGRAAQAMAAAFVGTGPSPRWDELFPAWCSRTHVGTYPFQRRRYWRFADDPSTSTAHREAQHVHS